MAKAYTRNFLIECFLSRFMECKLITIEQLVELEAMAERFYDEVGKDKFRVYASLDAERIQEYMRKQK